MAIEGVDQLTEWTVVDRGLERELMFESFAAAFGFMATVAVIAEGLDHHPDWSNSYNRVKIRLTTHDTGGISRLDVALAEAIDAIPGVKRS